MLILQKIPSTFNKFEYEPVTFYFGGIYNKLTNEKSKQFSDLTHKKFTHTKGAVYKIMKGRSQVWQSNYPSFIFGQWSPNG